MTNKFDDAIAITDGTYGTDWDNDKTARALYAEFLAAHPHMFWEWEKFLELRADAELTDDDEMLSGNVMRVFDVDVVAIDLWSNYEDTVPLIVQVLDCDGCQVIRVYDEEDEEVVLEHDTGLDGNVFDERTHKLAQRLVEEGKRKGLNIRMDGDDEPADEDDEPDEGDLTSTDNVHWYQYGKLVLTIPDGEDRNAALRAFMDREQFWPSAYSISDHGNAVIIDHSDEDTKS